MQTERTPTTSAAKDSRCWGQTYELHTPVLENLSIHDTSTHGTRNTHRTQSNDRQHLSVVRLNNFSTAFKPCSLLAPPQPPQATTTTIAILQS